MPRGPLNPKRAAPKYPRRALFGDHHLHVAVSALHRDRDVVVVALEADIQPRAAELDVVESHAVEEAREDGVLQADAVALMIELEAETRGQERERRRCRPGLRATSHRIRDR